MRHVIFLSYRTEDSLAVLAVDHVFAALTSAFDVDVFKDNERIDLGESIADAVREHLQRATILVVAVGTGWFNPREGFSSPPVHDDDDWVRTEIRTALERKIAIIPVYVGRERIRPRDLPPDIRAFAEVRPDVPGGGLKSVEIRSANRKGDLDALVNDLAQAYALPRKAKAAELAPSPTWRPATDWQLKHLERLIDELGVLSPAIPARDARQRIPIGEVFVPLELGTEHGTVEAGAEAWDRLIEIERSSLIALTGGAGSGKSTLLRHLALHAAHTRRARLQASGGAAPSAGVGTLDRIPLAIDLPGAARILRKAKNATDGPLQDVLPEDWLAVVRSFATLADVHQARGLLETGELLLLFDGLDEVADPQERFQLVTSLSKLSAAYGAPGARNPVVVACRERAWERGKGFALFDRIVIRQMAHPTREAYLRRWCQAVWRDRAAEVLGNLADALRTSRAVQEMASNPQIATMLAVRASSGPLPTQRVTLYDEIVLYALQSERMAEYGNEPTVRKHIIALALEMSGQRGGETLSAPRAAHVLGQRLVPPNAPSPSRSELRERGRELLRAIELHTGLISVDRSEGDGGDPSGVRFAHRTIQEFLVACHHADLDHPETILEHATNPAWLTSIALTAGVLARDGFWDVLERFLEALVRAPDFEAPADLTAWGKRVAVLSECLEELSNWRPPDETIAPARRAYEQSGPRLMRFDLASRVAIADGMGILGDPRLAPRSRWVRIDGGPSVVGSDSLEAWRQERPARDVTLSPFWIQRWPTTVREYARFVDDASGYASAAWWDEDGWRWREHAHVSAPCDWERQRTHGNRPVWGLSWWEARAYARWLSTIESLPDGWSVSLPTEAQWERAARGPSARRDRRFPWGEQWSPDLELASCGSLLHGVCAVGLFPDGNSAEDIWDLAGNVGERCLDGFGPPGESSEADPCCLDYRFGHAVRGGDHSSPPLNVRVSARFPDAHDHQSPRVGVRYVAWRVPSHLR